MSSVISISHLSKYYQVSDKSPGLLASIKSFFYRPSRTIKAVDNISFDIDQGEFVGFVGPNGAGKTTTLKMLSGLLFPTSGSVSVLGFTPFKRQYSYLRQIGFIMGQKSQLWWDLPPQETFLLHQAIYHISEADYRRRLDYFIDILDLSQIISVPTKKLSLGQRMKCELVASLLHQPQVIFLDEPTIGLDIVASQAIRKFLLDYNRQFHATIILTSHNLDDVQKLCRRLIVINHGQISYDGDLIKLEKKYHPQKTLQFIFSHPVKPSDFSKYRSKSFTNPYTLSLTLPPRQIASATSDILSHFPVVDINIESTPIETIISRLFTSHD